MKPQHLKVKDTELDQWPNQKIYIHHFQHAINQLNLLTHSSDDTADYRVSSTKRNPKFHHACPITTKATFSSLKYVEYAKN